MSYLYWYEFFNNLEDNINAKYETFLQRLLLGTKLKFYDLSQQMPECISVPSLHGLTADAHSDVVMYCFLSHAVCMLFYLQEAA